MKEGIRGNVDIVRVYMKGSRGKRDESMHRGMSGENSAESKIYVCQMERLESENVSRQAHLQK